MASYWNAWANMASVAPESDHDTELIECDVCALMVSFSDYASHVESHLAQFYMMAQDTDDRADDYELNLLMQDLMGRVEIGVDDISRVALDVTLKKGEAVECPICLEVQCKKVKRTLCKHDFCIDCITRWLSTHKTCPICMADIQMLSTTSSGFVSSSSIKATTSSSARRSEVPEV